MAIYKNIGGTPELFGDIFGSSEDFEGTINLANKAVFYPAFEGSIVAYAYFTRVGLFSELTVKIRLPNATDIVSGACLRFDIDKESELYNKVRPRDTVTSPALLKFDFSPTTENSSRIPYVWFGSNDIIIELWNMDGRTPDRQYCYVDFSILYVNNLIRYAGG